MAVTLDRSGHVGVVTISRPERANAIDLPTARELSAIFDDLEADDTVRAIVVTGAGERVFSAGMDLESVRAGLASEINAVPGGFAGIVNRSLDKPVIAAVNGAAFGGGFEIVLACDMVVANENARFALPEVTLGLVAASGGAVRLPLRLPRAIASELLLTGEPVSAQRAFDLGLVNLVVPTGQALTAAMQIATKTAGNGPLAVRATKRIARTSVLLGEEAAWQVNDVMSALITRSDDAREAALARTEGRPPRWSGR
jgi:enoyl-CoA hydratase/carnithine racemase